jgi:outer membrane lipopolysaccharide assembly protein LptE/RlpB
MKKLFLLSIFILLSSCGYAYAQTEQPEKKVEILQSTADACADCFNERKALRQELADKNLSITELKDEIVRLKVELARNIGEKIGVENNLTECRADKSVLLKLIRPKKIGLVNF